jgi:hypothetical protein
MHTGLWWKILQERDSLDIKHVTGEANIATNLQRQGVDWIHLDQDSNQWQVVVTTLTTF